MMVFADSGSGGDRCSPQWGPVSAGMAYPKYMPVTAWIKAVSATPKPTRLETIEAEVERAPDQRFRRWTRRLPAAGGAPSVRLSFGSMLRRTLAISDVCINSRCMRSRGFLQPGRRHPTPSLAHHHLGNLIPARLSSDLSRTGSAQAAYFVHRVTQAGARLCSAGLPPLCVLPDSF